MKYKEVSDRPSGSPVRKRDERTSVAGVLLLLLSAFAFALSTVFVKIASNDYGVSGITISFFRFSFGLMVIVPFMLMNGKSFRPNNSKFVVIRGVSNATAVMLFFAGVQYTTISNANILNMTYPAFVFLAAPFINKEKIMPNHIFFLALTIGGGYLISSPAFGGFNPGDIMAFLSGAVAGIAISSLRESRKYDDTSIILFYLMLIGTLLSGIAVIPFFAVPPKAAIVHIAGAAVLSLAGQLFLTIGYRYIEAGAGSIVSSSRIPVAAAFGVMMFGDPITLQVVGGGLLIIASMIGISYFSGSGKKGPDGAGSRGQSRI